MPDFKVLNFNKPEPKPERQPQLPTEEVLRDLLLDKPMRSCVVVVVNEDGVLSYWVDGLSAYEGVGVLETAKLAVLNNDIPYEDCEDE